MTPAPDDLDRLAMEHVRWLAQTGRHTRSSDALADYAISRGWARPVPGTMGPGWFCIMLAPEGQAVEGGGMTRERLEALHALVAAVLEWSNTPMMVEHLTPAERRMVDALAAVEACGAAVAVSREREAFAAEVALNTPQAPA